MPSVPEAVTDFLAQQRTVVAGVSRTSQQPANAIYRRLKETGHVVAATNPAAEEVEGDRCYPDLRAVPGPIDGVVIATPPAAALDIAEACVALGVRRVWFHRSFGEGSVQDAAVARCREEGLTVIVGGCPMMYCGSVDPVHRCMRWFLRMRGRIEA